MVSPQNVVGRLELIYICCKLHGDDDGMLYYHLPMKIGASGAVCVNNLVYSSLVRVVVKDRPS